MDELGIQRELVAAAEARGAFAMKMSHRFMIGVLDLFVQWPGLPALWIEVKYERPMPRSGFARPALTPRQRQFMIANQAAGGRCGWVLVAAVTTRGDYLIRFGTDPRIQSVDMRGGLVRPRGGEWPIEDIVRGISA